MDTYLQALLYGSMLIMEYMSTKHQSIVQNVKYIFAVKFSKVHAVWNSYWQCCLSHVSTYIFYL